MRESTRALKALMMADIDKLRRHNNSKDEKRTPKEIARSRADKARYYREKWLALLDGAETDAQRAYCKNVLERI